ncbi:autotransporter outer membrane beta-barrel domain-containing protein [Bosea sp. 2KB_26]|uniref:autotransporter family protein n=1 Tax=Bosea sp. 2KB_26 TaxID=3237475 RepID=UPI003F920E10
MSLAIACLASAQVQAQSYTYADGEVRGTGVTAPSTLTVGAGASATQAGAITGGGGVVKAGDGTLTLTGTSSYAGTTISGGTLHIRDGGTVTNSGALSLTGANAGLTISGPGSRLTTANTAGVIGSVAGVTMTVKKGGIFQNTTGNIGVANVAGTQATVNIIGAGSEFRTQSAISSLHGNATYNILDGGAIIHGGQIAMGAGISGPGSGSATILISGAGSRWQSTVGYFGDVSLTILDGGVMQNGNMSIGHLSGKTANILISGAGSEHRVNALTFGTNGTGIITVAEGGTFGFVAVAPSRVLTINKGGTINIGGAVGGPAVAAGTLDVASIAFAGGTGALNFNHNNSNYVFELPFTGNGTINQSGPGTTRLNGDNSTFSGVTTVQAGALSVNGVLGGTLAAQGGRLQGIGTVGSTTNAAGGTIAPGNSIGTLTINGNYVGNGGRLEIETVLGGDASPADRLVITGSSAGTTRVTVLNQGGSGAPTVEGIRIVDVGGASNGSFTLANGDYAFQGQPALIAGAYAYTLQQNGVSTPNDGDWYLRSAYVPPAAAAAPVGSPARTVPILQPGVPVYESYGQVLQSLNSLPTLRQRVGDRMHSDGTAPAGTPESQAIWARIEGAHSRITPRLSTSGTSYEIDSWRLQAGLEGQLLANGAGTLVGGLTAHHGGATADIASVFGRGKIATSGTGFGGTLTWYGQSGLYADAQAQASWFDSDLSSTTLGRRLADGTGGFGYAFGLELGQRIALNGAWSLIPQAQLTYSRVTADSFTDPFGARVSLGDGDSLKGRLGLAADYRNSWRDSAGQLVSTTLYGIANLSYEFLDGTTASVSGARFSSAEERLWGGLGLGAKYDWGRYSLYGEASVRTSLAQFADSYELSGRAGFRMSW